MVSIPIRPPNRAQLDKITGGDVQATRLLEDLFSLAGSTTPEAIVTVQADLTTAQANIATNATNITALQGTVAGLGTMATQAASAVAITGGAINGATIGATTPAAIRGTSVTSTGAVTGGFNAAGSGVLALAFGTQPHVSVTPNANGAFTSTVPPAGTICSLTIKTSGTTSYNMTFGSDFKSQGTLPTGAVDGKTFVVAFISDGVTLNEMSRTSAM